MDVLNIIINPSEKAECGNGTALPEVPPGAAPGGGHSGGTAGRPGPGAPRAFGITAVRLAMAKSDFKFNTVELD